MSNKKVGLPKGTRDFGPKVMAKRNYIFEIIKNTFQKFGFSQIETPAMENIETLTGKYGDEGDQLLYKVLDSGDFLKKVTPEDLEAGYKKTSLKVVSKGLKYDLTVPFSRYVASNYGQLVLPFKRFQIQPVWRADRPQKGRYREFYQCDADVVGSNSLVYEAEVILMIQEVFEKLQIKDYTIKLNNRKILSAFAELIQCQDKEGQLFVIIDKLDKIGLDKVIDELVSKGFTNAQCEQIKGFLTISGTNDEKLTHLKTLFTQHDITTEGIEELRSIISLLKEYHYSGDELEFDVTLARGLSYYTGAIFEVKVNNVSIGSVSGGGRYDDLTKTMGLDNVSGIGFSFGIDRIYDVLEELKLFPVESLKTTQVLIAHFDKECLQYSCGVATALRKAGISTEVYPDNVKITKQFKYADKKGIPSVVVIGSEELQSGTLVLKTLATGEQEKITLNDLIEKIKN